MVDLEVELTDGENVFEFTTSKGAAGDVEIDRIEVKPVGSTSF